jgi:ferredoxin
MRDLKVDLDVCQGHGKCYMRAPKLFEPFDDWGHAKYVGGPLDENDAEMNSLGDLVIQECPERALSWSTIDS